MKKIKTAKLHINAQTIRNLDSHGLRRAVGGMPSHTLDVAFTCIESDTTCLSCAATECCQK